MPKETQLLIIGAGITGAALAFAAARYSNIKRIAVVEKYPLSAHVNSNGYQNSQTLHAGDIETNYTLAKACEVKAAAQYVKNYARQFGGDEQCLFQFSKMVLGVGEQEVELLRKRYLEFGPHFPNHELFDRAQIKAIEPNVVKHLGGERKEPLIACGSRQDYCAADFAALTRSFLHQAQLVSGTETEMLMSTKILSIHAEGAAYRVQTSKGRIDAEMVVVCAGGHSLLFAHSMGHGLHLSCLPVAGSFFHTPRLLNGKVYTVQNNKLPFAAVHGDPDLLCPGKTRFGPTALVLPLLERRRYRTFFDFLKVVRLDRNVLAGLKNLLSDREIRRFILRNFLYELPFFHRYFFVKNVRKIIPDLGPYQIRYARGMGGLRPQLLDKNTRGLALGEAKIDTSARLIFNITPSPGASSCLDNARQDLIRLASQSGYEFRDSQWLSELGEVASL